MTKYVYFWLIKTLIFINVFSQTTIQNVPYFYQLNNSINPHGSCQNTTMAMLLKYLGGNIKPDDISLLYGTQTAQSVSGFVNIFNIEANRLSLPYTLSGTIYGSFSKMKQLLDKGQPVPTHGYFTSSGHVVLVVGYDATGYICHDLYGKWDQVYGSGNYVNTSTAGKYVKYSKSAFEYAVGVGGQLWMYEVNNFGNLTLSFPENNQRRVEIKPTLSWNAFSGAASYQLQMSLKSDFSSDVILNANINNSTFFKFVEQSLDYGVKYYWRVKPDNNSNWSSIWSFTTEPLQPIWVRSLSNNNIPSWFGENTERGLAYTNGKVYIVSRKDGAKIIALNALTGQEIGYLDVKNISGGTYVLNDIETAWDGKILACNLTTNSGEQPFKIYKWNNEFAEPELLISYNKNNYRLGDNFTVYGSLSSNAAIFAAAENSNKVLRWIIKNGDLISQTPTEINLDGITKIGSRPSVGPYGYGSSDDFYVNSNEMNPTLFSASGQMKGSISGSIVPKASTAIKTFVLDDKRYLAFFQTNNTPDDPNGQNIRIIDISKGSDQISENDVYSISPRLGNQSNPNQTGDFAYFADDKGNYVFYVLSTNNGIAAYWCKEAPLYKGGQISDLTTSEEKQQAVTMSSILCQNYPNPFNPTTFIKVNLPENDYIILKIYNILGKEIQTLANGCYKKGEYEFIFNAKDLSGGVYIYELKTRYNKIAKKMLLAK